MVPGTDKWQYVKPIPGHAICNIGDAMTIFSGGLLKSNLLASSRFRETQCMRYCRQLGAGHHPRADFYRTSHVLGRGNQ